MTTVTQAMPQYAIVSGLLVPFSELTQYPLSYEAHLTGGPETTVGALLEQFSGAPAAQFYTAEPVPGVDYTLRDYIASLPPGSDPYTAMIATEEAFQANYQPTDAALDFYRALSPGEPLGSIGLYPGDAPVQAATPDALKAAISPAISPLVLPASMELLELAILAAVSFWAWKSDCKVHI